MKSLLVAAAASLAIAAPMAAYAQDTTTTTVATDANGDVYVMTDEQQSAHDSWPSDKQSTYDSWPVEYQTYYWTLSPGQQKGWWVLTDDQRAKVYAMTPDQQAAAWNSIASQLSAPAPGATPASATSGNIDFVSTPTVQSIPTADQAPPPADLPICSKDQQDNCINAWEAGKRGKGVVKPLDYWPGKPASSMPGNADH